MPPSSRGLGRGPFKAEIRGSNPLGGTNGSLQLQNKLGPHTRSALAIPYSLWQLCPSAIIAAHFPKTVGSVDAHLRLHRSGGPPDGSLNVVVCLEKLNKEWTSGSRNCWPRARTA